MEYYILYKEIKFTYKNLSIKFMIQLYVIFCLSMSYELRLLSVVQI